ncbi:LuxR family transcriptional regulator [Mycolicibacterium sp. P9-22]|uniref:helix-turn-helix transcriptional regulator n=1 Tax=Mycolicibacterium sp. P9-22 TaxID=2024613 RepID=UPI0011EF4F5F|nr:LuxR family transcriptional regulator [Mycolicibacterium sp. P9-22]KAA0112478.1 helix-turn-helix transcriptional regulator [Mycolicibacterium sp. P9-22]
MSHAALVGRADESRALRALLTRARNGLSESIVLCGDPGIGKTALLDSVTAGLTDFGVIRCDGFEAELAMPYAALHRVGRPLLDHLAALPERQQQALAVAWGADGPPPDRYLVGLGILGLFAAAGSVRPLVCVIDDAQWLDAESRDVLAFVARRLQAESTVLLFAARDSPDTDTQLAGIPVLQIGGLDVTSAVRLLTASAPEVVDPHAARQIADATGGNPLALIDLARELSTRRLSEFSVSAGPVPISRQLEQHYLRRVRDMPTDVQTWLLVAAAEPAGHTDLIAAAAADLGLPDGCGAMAERAGLVRSDATVVFRHPLVRSAVYGAAAGEPRRRVESALARQAERLQLTELAAWHAAEATLSTDTAVADRLEAVAETAGRRGGLASQANLLARAADLTPRGNQRNVRLLAAAEIASDVGAAQFSGQLLERLDETYLDGVQRGRIIMLRSALAMFTADSVGTVHAPFDLLRAAEQFRQSAAPDREQRALLRAFELSLATEHLMQGTTLAEIGRRLADGAATAQGPSRALLAALSAHILAPYPDAAPLMRAALDGLFALDDTELPRYGFSGIALAVALFDSAAGVAYLSRLARIASDSGALRDLDAVLWVRTLFEIGRGDPAASGAHIEQVREIRRAIGYDAENVINVSHLIWTGLPRGDAEMIAAATRAMGFGGVEHAAKAALATRDIADGRYAEAYEQLRDMLATPFLQPSYLQLPDFVEAAARSGRRAEAARTAAQLTTMAAASGTAWLQGLDHRCRALLATDPDAEDHFLRCIELLDTADVPADLGRAHLLYGEWLRRMRRRRLAREQLQCAIDIFERIEAPAFGERARAEMSATGAKVRTRHVVSGVELSSQEAAVAQMAAAGKTNAEIGTALFISANTVDYHLRKVFGKLAISSRRQLSEHFRQS